MKLFAWGTNSHGQLGLGFESELVLVPTQVPLQSEKSEINLIDAQIIGGGNHTIIRTSCGKVFGAGLDSSGQLCGLGGSSSFTTLNSTVLTSHLISIATCGWDFSLFITNTGILYGCGSNKFGQLGSSTTLRGKTALNEMPILDNIVHISAGLRHCAALTATGTVCTWGCRKYFKDEQTQGLKDITKLVCGQQHCVTLNSTGCLFAWGANHYGQCGQDCSTITVVPNPLLVAWDFSHGRIVDIASGWSHSLLLTDCGHVYTFGRNTYGQLGRPSSSPNSDHIPARVDRLEGIVSIAAGSEHSIALDEQGQLWTWGWNEHGSCGNGDTVNQYVPVNISNRFPGRVSSIGCGAGHCFAVVDS